MTVPRTGGELLVDGLRRNGTEIVFGVPGESYVAALDAMYGAPTPRFILCRHESAASHAAEAYGKTTGRPGVCFVTRGPGATHASVGVHTASQDCTPMILLVGTVTRYSAGRDAWQEIDLERMFGGMAKWAAQIHDAARIPEYLRRAYATAVAGRPGPVVLGIPEDALSEIATVDDLPPYERPAPSISDRDLERMRAILDTARQPLMLLGGGDWDDSAWDRVRGFAERNGLPVATTFRRQDLFDNEHPLYAGTAGIGIDPALARRVRDADVILAVGTRLDEVTTSGYTLLLPPVSVQRLIHVHPGPEELGHVYVPELAIQAAPGEFAAALERVAPVDGARWAPWAADAHADYVRRESAPPSPGRLDMVAVMAAFREIAPADAIVTTGAGNYAVWSHRFHRYRVRGTQLAPISGSMGYGLPAAIAAQLAHPDRVVIAFAGDGCFQMSGHELGTARQYDLPIVVIIVNNGIHGSIRMHQERQFPGRVIATDIVNPDFTAYAAAFGAETERVETAAAFGPALQRAIAARKLTVLELVLDVEALTPDATLSEIRERAQRSLSGLTVAATPIAAPSSRP